MIIMSPMGAADCRALHGIAGVEEVVGREILKQVTDQALDQQRSDDGDGNMFGGIFASPPIEVTDSKPTRIRMATVA
jgi:hypothetical protein